MAIIPMMAHYAGATLEHIPVVAQMAEDSLTHFNTATAGNESAHVYFVADSGITVDQFKEKLSKVTQETQVGWLANAAKYFIGIFQKGGEVFVGFVTGIVPTLVVLMTAFYAVTGLVGEDRVHGVARSEYAADIVFNQRTRGLQVFE